MKKIILFLVIATFININVIFVQADTIASDCAVTKTLRVGSAGSEVACLQASLGISADGKFGPMTRAAVLTLQRGYGLSQDGVFGPNSRAAWVANRNFPPQDDCRTGYNFSPVTGKPCPPVSNSSAPVISGVSGPQSLNVNQTGTWTVNASDKNGGTLKYSVIWGDEIFSYGASYLSLPQNPVQQSATFTHTYVYARRFNPTFTVTNDIVCFRAPCPNSASSSVSVNVGEIITPTEKPTISSISPESGVVGSEVRIYGTGFTLASNRIKFGDLGSENDPKYSLESDGGSIAFTVPAGNYFSCWATEPACMVAMRMTQPGTYEVSVINNNGTSNAAKFTVLPTYTTN